MALSQPDVTMWTDLAERQLIPPSPRVLEIGQANWYGDIPPPPGCESDDPYEVARKWYRQVLDYSSIVAIDWGAPDAIVLDLNEPALVGIECFEIVINTGTTEHIFDQRTVFESIHDACTVGGLMVHAVPSQGWPNHGLYNYQPCFFEDLARANEYEKLYVQYWWQRDDMLLYVVLRKTRHAPFRVPIQGRYAPA